MWGILSAYWPHVLAVISLVMATVAGAHAVMTKDEVRGAIKAAKTTPLLTFDEGVDALRKAKGAQYAPPATEIPYFGTFRPTE